MLKITIRDYRHGTAELVCETGNKNSAMYEIEKRINETAAKCDLDITAWLYSDNGLERMRHIECENDLSDFTLDYLETMRERLHRRASK